MSYSQLVLADRPYGYWDCAGLSGGDLEDLTGFSNPAVLSNVQTDKKPIIYGPGACVKLTDNSSITIQNIYKVLFSGSENKPVSIDFFFSIEDSSTTAHTLLSIGNLLTCYVVSDKIYIQSGNIRSGLSIPNWDSSQYVCIIYKNNTISLNLNGSKKTSIYLGDDFSLPDLSPPDLVFGPSADPELPLYLNSIAIYTYEMLPGQMLTRLSWAGYDASADSYAVANGGEVINPISSMDMENLSIDLMDRNTLQNGEYSNILIKDDILTLNPIPPVNVESIDTSLNYSIDIEGISFGGGSFIEIKNPSNFFKGYNNIIRQQVKIDGLATDQSILFIGPFIDDSFIQLYKSSSNTIVCSSISSLDVETILAESSDLGADYSEYFNIALTFQDNYGTLIVNDEESSVFDIPGINTTFKLIIGNGIDYDSPLTSKIKNFSIDNYIDGDTVSFDEIGKYCLRFYDSFSVSQTGEWNYRLPIINESISSYVSYNFAAKGIELYVNGSRIIRPGTIPEMIYNSSSSLDIKVLLKTYDSIKDLPVMSELEIKTFDSTYLSSGNGIYSISPIEIDYSESYPKTDPYEIKVKNVSALSRPNNIGINFVRQIEVLPDIDDEPDSEDPWVPEPNIQTSGGSIVINTESSSDYIEVLEFLVRLNSSPADSEEYSILDVLDYAIAITYSDSGLSLTSGYDLYIDGVLASGGETLEENEFYYLCAHFDSPVSSEIYLGISEDSSLGFNGSMGNFVIHNSTPQNISSYVSSRYNAIIGRPILSKVDNNSIEIFDNSSSTQEFVRSTDGKYFAMKHLPKAKIVQNKWETVK